MAAARASVAVILCAGGDPPDLGVLGDFPLAGVVRAEVARGLGASCLAVTIRHDGEPGALLAALRPWAADRGWSVAIAPLPGGR